MTKENYEREKARREMRDELAEARKMREDREVYRMTILASASVVLAGGSCMPPSGAIETAEELYSRATDAANKKFSPSDTKGKQDG